jgi:hypothetical protein
MLTRRYSVSRSHLCAMEIVGLVPGEYLDDFVYERIQISMKGTRINSSNRESITLDSETICLLGLMLGEFAGQDDG